MYKYTQLNITQEIGLVKKNAEKNSKPTVTCKDRSVNKGEQN